MDPSSAEARALVRRLVDEGPPHGEEFRACRAVVTGEPAGEAAFEALCMILEGALADPGLAIDDTHTLVAVLKGLARGAVTPGELL
jgi:hypothetical protein